MYKEQKKVVGVTQRMKQIVVAIKLRKELMPFQVKNLALQK